ncbi:drug/metabolite exporter YedA [Planotetraspora phitsanulokensis]|uniref:Drug/metabolite exporter YedA n=1 Tax=Planotetraspora phitsanulokensis TaxID=575192 RepID=A0A8J3U946_9ACTN|nr:EamA family transporter [Planotetraspora phitsanulokensis]GII41019.1 drug/metabolite exporter YedA [Planotetraspora phitsanulokensis]
MGRNGRDIRVWLALGAVYVIWGSTYLGIKFATESIPPLLSGGLRFITASLILGTVLLARKGFAAFRITWREFGSAALVGLLLLTAGNGMVALAEQYISSGLAALLVASVPLWLIVLRMVVRDRPHLLTMAGVLVGFVGVAGLSLGGGTSAGTVGILVILLASISWSLGSFLSPRISMPKDPFMASTIEMVAGGAGLLVLGTAFGERLDLGAVTGRSWLAVAYLVVAGSLVAFTSYVWLLGNAPISLVSTYAYVNPVVAVLLGMVVVGEQVTHGMLLAGALIVVGVALVVSTERRSPAVQSDAPSPRVGSPEPRT